MTKLNETRLNVEYWEDSDVIKSTDNDFNWQRSRLVDEIQEDIKKSGAKKLNRVGRTAKGQPYYTQPLEKAYQKAFFTKRGKR
jgi:hypothetical protein